SALFVVPLVPNRGRVIGEEYRPRGSPLVNVTLLMSVFCFFLGLAIVWPYLFLIGTGAGLQSSQIALFLSLSQFAAIAGGLAVAYFRSPNTAPTFWFIAAVVTISTSLVMFEVAPSSIVYLILAFSFSGAATFGA